MLRYIFLFFLTWVCSGNANGQKLTRLTLEEAYQLLEERYPSLQNASVLDQIYENEMEQLDIAQKPSIILNGEGRLQSERLKLGNPQSPINVEQPLVNIKSYVEAQYLLIDGGLNDAKRTLKAVQLESEKQNIEVERFSLRARIDALFLNINLIREQSKLFELSLADIRARKESIKAAVDQGVALESELTKLEVKELEVLAAQDDIRLQLSGLINSLADLIDKEISNEVNLILPQLSSPRSIPKLKRPELQLFELQEKAIQAQSILIDVDKMPKLSAFAQTGFGYPNALNFSDNSLAPYGILGAKFTWKLTDWNKANHQKELLNLQSLKIQNAKKTFEFNLNSKEAKYLAEINRLTTQINNDQKIADLQSKILEQLGAQLDEGIITTSEYVTQVNAELRARQNQLVHQKQLEKIQLEFWSERGAIR